MQVIEKKTGTVISVSDFFCKIFKEITNDEKIKELYCSTLKDIADCSDAELINEKTKYLNFLIKHYISNTENYELHIFNEEAYTYEEVEESFVNFTRSTLTSSVYEEIYNISKNKLD